MNLHEQLNALFAEIVKEAKANSQFAERLGRVFGGSRPTKKPAVRPKLAGVRPLFSTHSRTTGGAKPRSASTLPPSTSNNSET